MVTTGIFIEVHGSKLQSGICCCLQTYKSVAYMLMIGLVLGQSLMVISTADIVLYAKISPLYNLLWECIVVVYT